MRPLRWLLSIQPIKRGHFKYLTSLSPTIFPLSDYLLEDVSARIDWISTDVLVNHVQANAANTWSNRRTFFKDCNQDFYLAKPKGSMELRPQVFHCFFWRRWITIRRCKSAFRYKFYVTVQLPILKIILREDKQIRKHQTFSQACSILPSSL